MLLKKVIILALALVILSTSAVNATMQEYIREYVHQVGDADSKVTSRQISMQEIKVELLGELGTYIDSRIEISQSYNNGDSFKQDVTALTAGFVRVELIEERFNGETYFLKGKLFADPDEIIIRINQLGKNDTKSKENKARLIAAYEDAKALRAQLAALQADIRLNKAAGKDTANLKNKYKEESKQLSAVVLFELGSDYLLARKGKVEDYVKAAKFFRESAEQGYVKAQAYLGGMYYEGAGVNQDYSLAVSWLHKAAEQGHDKAQGNLGFIYYNGEGVTQDDSQAVFWYRKSAEQGNELAQYYLGLMYENGEGITEDNSQAVLWYRKAAEQGHADAQYKLGLGYFHGEGVTEDNSNAMLWFRKAAKQDNAEAQTMLGVMYSQGIGVRKDDSQAVFWVRKAVEQGHAEAQLMLGFMYYEGIGVTEDDSQAVFWVRKAAEQGHAEAQYRMGVGYYEGDVFTKDIIQAVSWFHKAAEQGHAEAQTMLVVIKGVSEDDS